MYGIRYIGKTYYARFFVPKARQADVGRSEVLKSLKTGDRLEAIRRRNGTLAAIEADLDAKLRRRGLPPLGGAFAVPWQDEALKDRAARNAASDDRDTDAHGNELGSPRAGVEDEILDRAHELEASHGSTTAAAYHRVAMGKALPLHETAERYHRDRQGKLRDKTIGQSRLAIRYLCEFMASENKALPQDPAEAEKVIAMEDVTRRHAGRFAEWMVQTRGLSGKTTASRISALSSLWAWCDQKGELDFHKTRSPWEGQTTGLKAIMRPEEDTKRPYTAAELVRLLEVDPRQFSGGRYTQAIRDLLRLGLLTGARQDSLCSLRRCDIIESGAGLSIPRHNAKTAAGVRRIPLHPIVQPITARRLAAAGPESTARLFPELPEGMDGKMNDKFASRFATFRQKVLGDDGTVDFHSLRRSFSTFFTIARAEGITECSAEVQKRLTGHKGTDFTDYTYTGRDLGWDLYVRAIAGMVAKGMPAQVREAVENCPVTLFDEDS